MSKMDTEDTYEVGYGRPPKNAQFQKGVSGNPRGRPKKVPDFHYELLREARASITLNENGRRRRISKHAAVIKQLTNNAMKGNASALRLYLHCYLAACDRVALSAAPPASDSEGHKDLRNLTDEELMKIISLGQKERQYKGEKNNISSKE